MSANTREDLQEHVIGVVRKSQEVTLATVKKAIETLSAATGKLPVDKLRVDKFEGKLHELPLAAKLHELPAPGTVVSSAFDFAGRLLAEQRTFAEELVKATAPLRLRAKDASDATDVKDVNDAHDVNDTQDASDTQDVNDANDAQDVNDAQGAPDTPQAPEAPGTPAA